MLAITGIIDAICGLTPNTFTLNLDSIEISFHFTTNAFDEGKGFWLKYRGEQRLIFSANHNTFSAVVDTYEGMFPPKNTRLHMKWEASIKNLRECLSV